MADAAWNEDPMDAEDIFTPATWAQPFETTPAGGLQSSTVN